MWLLCEVVCLVLWLKWVLILWFKILFWTFLFNLIFAWPLDMWKVLPFRVPLLPCGKKGINFSCMWIWWFDKSWRMIYFVIVTYVKLGSICDFPEILVLCLLISYFVHCYGLTKRRLQVAAHFFFNCWINFKWRNLYFFLLMLLLPSWHNEFCFRQEL